MTEELVRATLKEVLIEEFEVEEDEIVEGANFFEDLDMDSLDAIDLIVMMDKKLNIDLKAEDAQKIRTIDEFVTLIMTRA
ncbi:MAG: phosphopantetheine-binding protein [Helicobacteraceae bacterium]|jgi:acyl carrier protein|nr:phosphopantetheine-binding protein [Helicobacteraceae bacterium]